MRKQIQRSFSGFSTTVLQFNRKRTAFSTYGAGITSRISTQKKTDPDPNFIPYIKINLKLIIGLNEITNTKNIKKTQQKIFVTLG